MLYTCLWNVLTPSEGDLRNIATVAYPGIFFRGGGGEAGGGSTNSVEDRENGDLGAVAP